MILLFAIACSSAPTEGDDSAVTDDSVASHDTAGSDDTGASDDTAALDDTASVSVPLCINELMAANEGGVVDDGGQPSDWFEIHNFGDQTVDLSGWAVSDDWTERDKHVLANGLDVDAGGYLVLWASNDVDRGDDHVGFKLSQQSEGVGLFHPDGDTVDWVVYPAQQTDYAWARIPDCGDDWVETPAGSPGQTNTEMQREEVTVVNAGATWLYDDTGGDLGVAWRDPDFDDSAWAGGPAPLGYGDTQTTVVSYGADSNNKHPTIYFRHAFDIPSGVADGARSAVLRFLVDDGAVVYLNGDELQRVNMAEGEVLYGTWASATVSGASETTYSSYDLDVSGLIAGENLLAVEVHQAGPTSSDATMDLTLMVTTVTEAR